MKTVMKRPWNLALAAVMLASSPPTFASTCISSAPPDDPIVQCTEQIDDGYMKVVTLHSRAGDLVMIPIVNKCVSDQYLEVDDPTGSMVIMDDHPRTATIDHFYLYSVNSTLDDDVDIRMKNFLEGNNLVNVDMVTAMCGTEQKVEFEWSSHIALIGTQSAPFSSNSDLISPADNRTDQHLLLPQPTRLVPVYPRE